MLFNDFLFLDFFFVVVVCTFLLRRWHVAQKSFLVLASYVFYFPAGRQLTLLLLISSLVDYGVGLGLEALRRPAARRMLLGASLAANLGLLGYFKYSLFVATSLGFAPQPGSLFPWHVLRDGSLLLPLGISFYTFQTMSYAIDRYWRTCPPCRSLLDFLLYVSFFPQLVAGPILRAGDFLPQLARPAPMRLSGLVQGLALVLVGLGKKVLIADRAAVEVEAAFSNPDALGCWGAWVACYLFAVQVYGDFSGYSDMARGLGRILGYRIPRNFRRPYLSGDPSAFWRTWHVTLSVWLRDYLFTPLGRWRRGVAWVLFSLWLTMVIAGLWHGAAWTFVLWGGYHGALLVGHRLWTIRAGPPGAFRRSRAWRIVSVLGTFHLVCLGWPLFRCADVSEALRMMGRMVAGGAGGPLPVARLTLAAAMLLAVTHLGVLDRWVNMRSLARHPWLAGAACAAAAAVLELYGAPQRDFIYFVF